MTQSDKVSWRYALGVGGAVVAILLSINGWLLTQGFGTINSAIAKNAAGLEKLCQSVNRIEGDAKERDTGIRRRVDRIEILLTMPFSKRVEVLQHLGGMIRGSDKDYEQGDSK